MAEAQDAAARRRHATVILARKIKVASRELDLPVHSRGAVRVTLPLILHLALAPTAGSLVQVDYEHRVLRVNERVPFMIQGYYDVPSCGRGTANATRACFNLADIHTHSLWSMMAAPFQF